MPALSRPSLGLGSRANQTTSTSAAARQTAVVKTKTTVTKSASTRSGRNPRGFGLFDADEEEDQDSDMDVTLSPVKFNGNRSGFASMSDSEGPSPSASRSTKKASSRISSLTTPRRKSAVSSRRSTPYHSTTSRALLRAKRGSKETSENEEERLISESMFGTSGSSKTQKGRFSMSGALAQGDQNGEVSTELESDADQQKTPSKDASSRKARTPRTKADDGKNTKSNGVVKQTWSQWLSSILPKSLVRSESPPEPEKKNVPQTPRAGNDSENDETESNYSTPFQTPRATFGDDTLDMPGSYEKPTAPAPKGDNFINPNFLNNDSRRTPVRGPGGFSYNPQSPYDLPSPTDSSPASSVASQTPQRSPQKKGSRSSLMAPTSARRMPSTPGAASYRKPSNFIERMRSAKQKRYDPYSRPSAAHRRAPGYSTITYEEFPKDMTPEEELEFLERRAKDRKVQEAEDRYLRRLTLKRLGRPVEDEEMSDPDTPPRNDKGKQLAIEDAQDGDGDSIISDRGVSTTPPDSPPQTPSLFNKSAGAPLFQFQPIAPKPPGSPEKLHSSPPSQQLLGDSDNDLVPPPPPVMSHRELPGPAQPASVPSLGGGLFGDKQPVGGFGISEAPSPVAKLRFDKFKPRVSSGLRESSTIEKENELLGNNNKENSSISDDNDFNSGSKGGKTVFGQQSTNKNKVSSSGALRELGKNSPIGMGIKVDVHSKIAALPVEDLSHLASWPMQLELLAKGIDQEVQSCVRDMFSSACKESWMSDWASNVFGDASAMVERL